MGHPTRQWQRDKVDPYPEEKMAAEGQPTSTICGVLREIHATTRNDEIRVLSRIATTMAKKMQARLEHYWRATNGQG